MVEVEGEAVLPPALAGLWLLLITAVIAALSEAMVSSIEAASQSLHVSVLFSSLVLLPFAGNAAEHASSLMFAWRDRLDISIGIAVGSSTQVMLLVLPMCVCCGWAMGQELSLFFGFMETAVWVLAVLFAVNVLSGEGRSNWLKGLVLVCGWLAIGATYVFR